MSLAVIVVMCAVTMCLSVGRAVLSVAGQVDAWGRMVGVHPGRGMLVARGTWSLQHGPHASREGGQANIHRLRDLTVRATSCYYSASMGEGLIGMSE